MHSARDCPLRRAWTMQVAGLAATWVFSLAVQPASAQIKGPVRVAGGLVSGVAGRAPSIAVFKGIPFAAPPVLEHRWRAPAPVILWDGVRKAEAFSASCMQQIVRERKPWTWEFMTHGEVSEDCLYLNVWTGAASAAERRPVFVYIYGGAFSEGSGAVPVYDGEGLAAKGLVVVTFNYRLGVLGFLAHPGLSQESPSRASGNYGLLDQVAALRWVHDNIAAFGGDPNRVAIAGQSAGGMSVHALIASPLAKGLFHRAIVQSGGSSVGGGGIALGTRTLADAEAAGLAFAEAKGAATAAALRALTWQQLTAPLPAALPGKGPAPPARFSPIVDGHVLPAPVREIVQRGGQNDVPTLTGVNTGELGGLMGPQGPVTVESFVKRARQQYGAMATRFLTLYPAGTDAEAAAAQSQSSRDLALVSLYRWSRERARTSGTSAFLYLWDHALPGPDSARFGAFHTSEVPYALNTLHMSDRPFTDADRKIADMMSSYWASFAAAGNPHTKGLPRWEAAAEIPQVMVLGDRAASEAIVADKARFAFLEEFLMKPPGSVLAPGAVLEKLAGGFLFTEGPTSDRDGNVFFTDQPNNRIMKWGTDGRLTTFLQPAGRANGMYFDARGSLLVCADEKTELWSISTGGARTVLARAFEGRPLNGPNDVWARPDGALYLTDPFYKRDWWDYSEMPQGTEQVYFLSADRKTLRRVTGDLDKPNGIIGTPDGKTLYVADIRAGKTYGFDIQPDGALTNKRLRCELGSDGMTLDTEGNLYLTGKGVSVCDASGTIAERIDVPEPWTANVSFGGRDHRTLFITASTGLYAVRLRMAGANAAK